MNRTHLEAMITSDQRTRERNMLFCALRQRRGHAFPRRLLTSLLWVFGVR
jgi:hypothetical protein